MWSDDRVKEGLDGAETLKVLKCWVEYTLEWSRPDSEKWLAMARDKYIKIRGEPPAHEGSAWEYALIITYRRMHHDGAADPRSMADELDFSEDEREREFEESERKKAEAKGERYVPKGRKILTDESHRKRKCHGKWALCD